MEVKVFITKRNDRKFWLMYYVDPVTSRREYQSSKETAESKALRKAGAWEKELNTGTYTKTSGKKWDEFVTAYETEVMPKLAESTCGIRDTVFNHLKTFCNPKTVERIATTRMMAEFQIWLRKQGHPDSTIGCYLGHLQPVFSWARKQGFIKQSPEFDMPKQPKGKLMKGRPLTESEFDKFLGSVELVRKCGDAETWKHFMRGLWFSGLRLAEALELSWDDDAPFRVYLSDLYPQFAIAGAQKNRKHEVISMAPEFWELISQTPESDRVGYVLPLPGMTLGRKVDSGKQMSIKRVSRTISDIGKKSGIITDRKKKLHATAHDLRRSFGTRWARRVDKWTLMKMMRHQNINTTMQYYVHEDAELISQGIWSQYAKEQEAEKQAAQENVDQAANRT